MSDNKQELQQEELDVLSGEITAPEDLELESEVVEVDDLATAHAEIEALNEALAQSKDQLLRMHAETENMRKRMEKQIDDARKFGVEKFAAALLDVVDNLERALAVEGGNEAGLREGVQLTLDNWLSTMAKFELKRIDAEGEKFDPHFHEALAQMPSDQPEGTVIAQHIAGYTLHGRLVRSAKVLVSSGS
ncbi:MAG: nucleotide exchange factor GrpE [Zetaproteobacteria bacterium]|nr:nucleotide exchange factor GrpE [Zetaproteobacteria bacterium]